MGGRRLKLLADSYWYLSAQKDVGGSPPKPFTLVVLQLPKLDTGHFEVYESLDLILILVGEDSELPCLRSPSVSAEYMELRWFQNPFSPAVLVHREGQELEEEQALEYQGR
uniref:butyrophilin subfamily 1 member A1-like n=1 Tax=Myodes glareolus TaxID=447135 RepID=UPI0020227D29|nr:butyrophilin subfamily 1 member A1-like [Myodes glareolus]